MKKVFMFLVVVAFFTVGCQEKKADVSGTATSTVITVATSTKAVAGKEAKPGANKEVKAAPVVKPVKK